MAAEDWKQVSPELIHNIANVWATSTGRVKVGDRECKRVKASKGKYGYYASINSMGHTLYFHRLVYFAHSDKSIEELKSGRIVFKNFDDPSTVIDVNGFYRSWFEDMQFEKSKFKVSEECIKEEETSEHEHEYGGITFGKWYTLYTVDKGTDTRKVHESKLYQICFLNNPDIPCIIKNIERSSIVKYHFHDGHDAYVSLKHGDSCINFRLSHIMVASAFPMVPALETVDHIDDNSTNHCILNLKWLSMKDNAKKGQLIQAQVRKKVEHIESLPDELWKPLPISEYTLSNYVVSNRGRVKRNNYGFLNGSRLRGKKYTYYTITTESRNHVKYYAHQLVFATFHGTLPKGQIILHNDSAPLTAEGTYRNWAEDLRAGSKSENNIEHHMAKRT
jgi:hypothetical protein